MRLRFVTALPLTLLLVAACSNPLLMSAANPGTPADSGQKALSPLPAQPPALQPAAPALVVSGVATFEGKPIANAALQVQDALTGQVLAVDKPTNGAGVERSVTTDSKGNFSLEVAGLAATPVVRLVVKADERELEALVLVGAAKQYQLADVTATNIDETSTVESRLAEGVLESAVMLTPAAAAPIVQDMLAQVAALQSKIQAIAAARPQLADLITQPHPTPQSVQTEAVALAELMGNAQLQTTVGQLDLGEVQKIEKAAQDAAERAQSAIALGDVSFDGTTIDAKVDAKTGAFAMFNAVNGQNADALKAQPVTFFAPPAGGGAGSTPTRVAAASHFDVTNTQVNSIGGRRFIQSNINATWSGVFATDTATTAHLTVSDTASDHDKFNFALVNGKWRMAQGVVLDGTSYPNQQFNPVTGHIGSVPAEIQAQHPTQSFYFRTPDGDTYNLFMDSSGLLGVTLYGSDDTTLEVAYLPATSCAPTDATCTAFPTAKPT